jgi:uncharacterized membrane protein
MAAVPASTLIGAVLLAAGATLFTVGSLSWRRRLPRNRFAGVRTPATLRSEAAFRVANRVAAPSMLASGVICAAGGALSFGTDVRTLTVIATVVGAGTIGLLLAGGLLGHRVAAAMPPPTGPCGHCACRSGCR